MNDIHAYPVWEKRKLHPLEIPVLLKLSPSNTLLHSVLSFDETSQFTLTEVISENEDEKAERKVVRDSWNYSSLRYIILRSRPLHLDLIFDLQIRLRIVSAYIQPITNLLLLRAADLNSAVNVFGEPGSMQFDYGSPLLALHTYTQSQSGVKIGRASEGKGDEKRVHATRDLKVADLLSSDVSEKTKAEVQQAVTF